MVGVGVVARIGEAEDDRDGLVVDPTPPSALDPASPGDGEPGAEPEAVGITAEAPSPEVEGRWMRLPRSPLPARTRASATWTGQEVLVYGGQPDLGPAGARFDPSTATWQTMAPSPVGHRVAHTATWTGAELVVFEGTPVGQQAATAAQAVDGAVYDPASDTWRAIVDAPINPRSGHVAVWTGAHVFVYGGSRTFESAAPAALYDPAADTWTLTSPAPLDRAFGLMAAVWTGEEVIVWSGSGDADMAAYDPRTDTWRLLPGSPLSMRSAEPVWTGREMLLLGRADREGAGGLAFDAVAERWTVLPASPQDFAATFGVVWTGSRAVAVGGSARSPGAAWDPGLGRWLALPPAPQPALSGHAVVWTGESIWLWGGQGDLAPLATGATFTPG